VLADQDGAFGNPTSDSARTRITLECRRALVVAYAPASHTVPAIESLLRETASTLTRHCGGAVAHLEVL